MLLTGANIRMFVEREGQRPQSQMLTEAMLVFEIGLDPSLKKSGGSPRLAKEWGVRVTCTSHTKNLRGCGPMFVT